MTPPRIIDIDDGTAMVVTDLHGAGDVYCALRDRFLDLRARGVADRFVICGDLIHGEQAGHEDDSLDMLLDVMRLQDELGGETVVMLLGNHEMPHIYGITLERGDTEYTPRFEAALARLDSHPRSAYKRADVIAFLKDLPFYIRTQAGVLLTHAGVPLTGTPARTIEGLLYFDHDAILQAAEMQAGEFDRSALREHYADSTGIPYDELARYYLGVDGPDDPRYHDLLRTLFIDSKNPDFALLWEALFTRNEQDTGLGTYQWLVAAYLRALSAVSPHEQRMLTAGHIAVRGGYALVGEQQLRFASYAHARPPESARYLLLDCARRVDTAAELVPHLHDVFAG